MREIFLPNPKKIQITNYSLYPNALDFEFSFVNGVNLVIGGNGMGKTTFVNIIKFALIGHYRKRFDYTRTYKDRKIEKRTPYSSTYYSNREDRSVQIPSSPTVCLDFKINKDHFRVERDLRRIELAAVSVNNKPVSGIVVEQSKYDSMSEVERSECLNFKYEQMVSVSSGLSFDDLIFFVNEILFFGEDHRTVLWNDEFSDVQNELFNKYFNEPSLDLERQEAIRQSRYFDSMSRHRSEDVRAIRKVLDKVDSSIEQSPAETLNEQILSLQRSIEKVTSKLSDIQNRRTTLEDQLRLLNDETNRRSLIEGELEKSKKLAENQMRSQQWRRLHRNYEVHLQSLISNSICPMCSQDLDDDFIDRRVKHPEKCWVCSQIVTVFDSPKAKDDYERLNRDLVANYNKIRNARNRLNEVEEALTALDSEFRKSASERRRLQAEMRSLEDKQQEQPFDGDKLQAFYDEIAALDQQKDEYQLKSLRERKKAERIGKMIEQKILENTTKFSIIFSELAERFLGVKCSLTFTDQGDGKRRFYPIIGESIRYSEDELSESQRFFIDHAFRMTILSFFYTGPSFYIVETPNSSLDIAYEKNAASVFTKFLERPTALVITTNLNNSDFLLHLITSAKKIAYVNLLEIGRKSNIQSLSRNMTSISNRILKRVHDK